MSNETHSERMREHTNGPMCAHLEVEYAQINNGDGTVRDCWKCTLCHGQFWPQYWPFPAPWLRLPAETHSEKELRGIVEKLREDARTFESPYWTHEPAEPDWDYVAKAFKEIADDIEAATPAPVQGEKGLRERIERIVKNWMWLRAPKAELEQALAATPANKDLAELEAIIIELRQELNVAHGANVREPGPTRLIELKARLEEWERAYHHKSCPAEYPYSEEPCTCYRGKRIAELNALLSSSSAGPLTVPAWEDKPLIDSTNLITQVTPEIGVYPAPSSAGEAAPACGDHENPLLNQDCLYCNPPAATEKGEVDDK
jgi:hypothetical protein